MRKTFLLPLLLFIMTASYAQTKTPSADEVLKPAFEQAGKENKNVLLIYHASWCGWCKKMDSALESKDVKPFFDRSFVITHLTVLENNDKKALENAGAAELLAKQGGANGGIPYWVIMDKNGKVLVNSQYKPGQNTGCPASREEVAYFISVLKKTSSPTEEELAIIEKRFRLNESE
jgi:thioredoxin-related protein